MNLPQVYMCSPSWTLLPPPSPYHPSGSSQCTSPKHPSTEVQKLALGGREKNKWQIWEESAGYNPNTRSLLKVFLLDCKHPTLIKLTEGHFFSKSSFQWKIKSETKQLSSPKMERLAVIKSKTPHGCQLWCESQRTFLWTQPPAYTFSKCPENSVSI